MSIKAYKGFDKNMQCRGFQFAEGETYHEETAKLCESGFHACEMPLDVLAYYAPGDGSIYREVTLDEVTDELSNDSKRCAKTITIGKELGIGGLIEAQIKFVKENSSLRSSETAQAQGVTQLFSNRGAAQATGNRGAAQVSGYRSAAQATGDYGAAQATGYQGAAQATGDSAVATAAGSNCRVMGALGCAIFAVERTLDGTIISVASAIVDGEKIKPDTWYKCIDGKFVKAT
nr:MAG TPA: hypothetical protein [Caudoviricetes sp.]